MRKDVRIWTCDGCGTDEHVAQERNVARDDYPSRWVRLEELGTRRAYEFCRACVQHAEERLGFTLGAVAQGAQKSREACHGAEDPLQEASGEVPMSAPKPEPAAGDDGFCTLCRAQGRRASIYRTRCAFRSGGFSPDNWNCGTANRLRSLLGDADESPLGTWKWRNDDSAASFGCLFVPEYEGHAGFYIVMAWYKGRGSTGRILRMRDEEPTRPLLLGDAAFAIRSIEAWRRKGHPGYLGGNA